MKEKILEALTTKFEGVKAELLERIAAKAAKTINSEDEITTYVEGVTIQQVIDAEGDRRATDAQKTAVANYEKKHNLKDGKAVKTETKQTEGNEPPTQDDMPAWAKALIDSNKAMTDRLNAMDGERTAKTRRSQLDEILKELPDKVKEMYSKNFERYNFKDDDDFSAFLEDIKTSATAFANELKTKGGVVTPPKSGGAATTGAVSPEVKARIDAQAKAPTQTAIKG